MVSFSSHLRRLQRRRLLLSSVSPGPPLLMGKQNRLKKSFPGGKSPSLSPASASASLEVRMPSAIPVLGASPPIVNAPASALPSSSAVSPIPDLKTVSVQDPDKLGLAVAIQADMVGSSPSTSTPIEGIQSKDTSPSTIPEQTAPVKVAAANPGKIETSPVAEEETWCDMFKGTSKKLQKRGSAFTLPSGELCVEIPDSIIEKHKKSWDSFILGQFYSDPPAQGTIHTIVNGIWSKHFKDISVSKLDGNAFLIRIPNVQTRIRVLNQRLWQIDGQTMFVAKWEPGVTPSKPELTSAPIWLELRKVPFQFFNDDGLERIASLVGDPKFLHPDTANKRNLEVAKVFTIIDPRKPLPEAVNVKFAAGTICRVEVSSPWMPPVCAHCKEVGHSLKRCRAAAAQCKVCSSTVHLTEACPKNKVQPEKAKQRRKRSKTPKPVTKDGEWVVVGSKSKILSLEPNNVVLLPPAAKPGIEASSSKPQVDLSKNIKEKISVLLDKGKGKGKVSQIAGGSISSEEEPDSSDIPSEQSEDEATDLEDEVQFTEVLSQRQQRSARGRGPKSN